MQKAIVGTAANSIKRTYATPALQRFGDVASLTMAGTISGVENNTSGGIPGCPATGNPNRPKFTCQ